MLVVKPVNIRFSFLFYMPIFFKIRKREKLKIQIVDNFSLAASVSKNKKSPHPS